MSTETPQVPNTESSQRRPRNRRRPDRSARQALQAQQGLDEQQGNQVENVNQRPNRPRRGGPASRAARGDGNALRQMTVASVSQNQQPASNGTGRGGSRGGRGGSRPTGRQVASRTVQGRSFGGQLTSNDNDEVEESQVSGANLSADAPSFIPGRPHKTHPAKGAAAAPLAPRKRRPSKSTAADLGTRIHEDIENHQYECAICTNEVLPNSKAWSCRTCWTVFHLGCIKKWANKQDSAMAQQQPDENGQLPPPRQWRCPGCNLPKDVIPKSFTCWCEKEVDPRPIPGLPPFSCGNTCARARVLPKNCPHGPCTRTCHAGVCPPCQVMTTRSCFCGKESATRRCVDTNYETGWSCGKVCGRLMPCGEHLCSRPCHDGSDCGPCEIELPAKCYCGKIEKGMLCKDREAPKESRTIQEHWTGIFNCGTKFSSAFDCGKHFKEGCQPQNTVATHCPRSPDVIDRCPCGKTKLDKISNRARQSCADPIPNCNEVCGKTLACGHSCEEVCSNTGACGPCFKRVPIKCRCGRVESTTVCHQGIEENPVCRRKCRALLHCKKHEHGEHCCPAETRASTRAKRKPRPLNSTARPADNDIDPEHICTRPCGGLLSCGIHFHEGLCHPGRNCRSCPEAIFHEIACHCGSTVLQPPLPCGTKPPPCRFQCARVKTCGHPQVPHNCHQDDEECPKCPFLTVKTCLCGRNVLKNQPCFRPEVRCAEKCGKKLRCGLHTCTKGCHLSGECEDADGGCKQKCGKEKSCQHPDLESACHAPYACKEEKPCESKILITCPCAHLKQEVKCNATKSSEGNNKKELKCNDECARLERNRKLAAALNINPATHTDDHVPYSTDTLDRYASNIQWAQAQEKEFRIFAADSEAKRLRFKPMPSPQRAFLHALAEDFGFDSEGIDPEPHRHIVVLKSPRFVMAPMKTLAESARIRQRQRALAPIISSTTSTVAPTVPKQHASNTVGEPYNGFIMTNVRFGLTVEELRSSLRTVIEPRSGVLFDISFLPSEEVVLKAASQTLVDRDLDVYLKSIKPGIARTVSAQKLGTIELCRLDASLNVERCESDSASSGGWSQVAAKGALPSRRAPLRSAVGGASSFTVLSLSSRKKKPQMKEEESVVDDWEAAELAEEEKEKAGASAGSEDEVETFSTPPGEIAEDKMVETVSELIDEAGPGVNSHSTLK